MRKLIFIIALLISIISYGQGYKSDLNLQRVTDGGNTTVSGINVIASESTPLTVSMDGEPNRETTIESNFIAIRDWISGKLIEFGIGSSENYIQSQWDGTGYTFNLNFPLPTNTRNVFLPDTSGTVALTSMVGLHKIKQVNTGYRLEGFLDSNYGGIGNNAVDLSKASLSSSTHGATGTTSFASGFNTTASGSSSFASGTGTEANGLASTAMGFNTIADGTKSFALGNETWAVGAQSFVSGNNNISNGIDSAILGGIDNNVLGYKAVILGGEGNYVASYGSVNMGFYATKYSTFGGWNTNDSRDRALNIGYGINDTNRRDIFTVLKSAKVGIDYSNFEANTRDEKLQIKGGVFAEGQYNINAMHVAPISATDTGTVGEIRVTSTFIYVCTATNTWVRSALTTW
jgi:hypothetical protein